jgi:hypothetical protein
MKALMLVAMLGGATMFARIGVMRALNRHVDPDRKDPHWGNTLEQCWSKQSTAR